MGRQRFIKMLLGTPHPRAIQMVIKTKGYRLANSYEYQNKELTDEAIRMIIILQGLARK